MRKIFNSDLDFQVFNSLNTESVEALRRVRRDCSVALEIKWMPSKLSLIANNQFASEAGRKLRMRQLQASKHGIPVKRHDNPNKNRLIKPSSS